MKKQRTIWLLSYRPLAASPNGPWKNHPDRCLPFEDASCRREPDFRAPKPTITSACRPDFVKKLNIGDIVIYVTVKNRYGTKKPHRKLVAVLVVGKRQTHEAYARDNEQLAANCIVTRNDPLPWEYTEGFFTDEDGRHTLESLAKKYGYPADAQKTKRRALARWDRIYQSRKHYSNVIASCSAAYLNITDPIIIPENIFDTEKFPGTQSGTKLTFKQYVHMLGATHISLTF